MPSCRLREQVLDLTQHHVVTRVVHLRELVAGEHERGCRREQWRSNGVKLTFVYRFSEQYLNKYPRHIGYISLKVVCFVF